MRSARARSSLSRRPGLRPAIGCALMMSRSSGSTRTTQATGCPTPETAWSAWVFWRSARVGKLHHDRSEHDLVGQSRTPGVATAGLSHTSSRRIARGHQEPCHSAPRRGLGRCSGRAAEGPTSPEPPGRGAVVPEVGSRCPYGSVALSLFSPRASFTEVGTDPGPPRCIMMVGSGTGR